MMSSSPPPTGQVIYSRVAGGAFFNRQSELEQLRRAVQNPAPRAVLILGPTQTGKTELLRTTFDYFFYQAGQALPLFYSPRRELLQPEKLARDFLFTTLRQYLAFIKRKPELVTAADLISRDLLDQADGNDYSLVRSLLEGYEARLTAGNEQRLLRYVFSAPLQLATHTPHQLTLLLDDAHLLNQLIADGGSFALLPELLREPPVISMLITGLQRALLEQLSAGNGLLGNLWLEWLAPPDLVTLQALLEQWCVTSGIVFTHEVGRLAIQHTDGNLFYLRALVTAAEERGIRLDNPIEFERLYVDELLRGRIAQHFSTLLRRLARTHATGSQGERAAPEIVAICQAAAESLAPVEFAENRLSKNFQAARLLVELHQHELITILDEHLLPAEDQVFRDWLAATQRRFAGTPVNEVRLELLSRYIKAVPQMIAASERHTLHARLAALLGQFDQQSIARSLILHDEFLLRYSSAQYEQILTGLRDETERLIVPQIIYVTDVALLPNDPSLSAVQQQPPWSYLLAYGFDEAVCDNEHETIWLVAVNASPGTLTEASVAALDQQLENFRNPVVSGGQAPRIVRWAVSKMGFTSEAVTALRERGFLTSDYFQFELLAETLNTLPAPERGSVPAIELHREETERDFDLAIPIGEDREIIAARVAEQIARAAGFSVEAVNQLKTALIESCLSLSASGMSADRRIHQRFHTDQHRMSIIVASSAAALDQSGGIEMHDDPDGIWRLDVLRSLVDEVTLARLAGGFRVVLTKRKATTRQ